MWHPPLLCSMHANLKFLISSVDCISTQNSGAVAKLVSWWSNSVLQAIMYVLCFRMKSLMDVPRFKSQLLLMPLEPVLKHKLDPLKVRSICSMVSNFRNWKVGNKKRGDGEEPLKKCRTSLLSLLVLTWKNMVNHYSSWTGLPAIHSRRVSQTGKSCLFVHHIWNIHFWRYVRIGFF